ncbi:ATPase [Candidatus Woesearchaeota archaeon]|nr:ATPase [Candidatus Woesearchaeota archaeon]|tara:strand:- start:58158 stop:60428 length:2271 start_codon:yes stop_codon:yes gene_type:complete
MAQKEIKLKVAEAVQDDVNKGIVRIDTSFMHEINVRPGDFVEIEGQRQTVGIADRAYPGDIGLNIIRMDGIVRRNSKTGIGEIVKVNKAEVKEAKKIIIAPARKGIMIRANPEVFKQGLLGRAVVKGDIVALGGTTRRRSTLSHSPFEDIFRMLDEDVMGFGFGDIKFVVVDSMPKNAVIVTDLTEVVFNPEALETVEEQRFDITYEDIGGLREEVSKIREMVELPLKHPEIFERLGIEAPKGVLLHGPPGTGKTLVAKAVANETNSHFIVINGPEIMSKFYGQSESNLRKKFEEASKNAPAIVFIDEIDAIATKREEVHGEVERRVVAQLLALMDGLKSRGKVVVIAATNVPNLLDPALRRPGRFDREIEISVPSKEGRLDILKIHTRNMPLGKNVNLKEIAAVTHGFVGADVAMLAKEAAMVVLRRVLPDLKLDEEEPIPKEILEKMQITKKDFKEALKFVRPSAMREVLIEIPTVKWDDLGGLEGIRQELIEAVEWPIKNPESFKNLGVTPPKGLLLYGAPGTGKTLLAKAVATESEANFILVNGPELLSKWVGESEKAVREVFKKARQTSPTIIFFDEIDSLAPKRGTSTDTNVTERVVNQLLTEIDGLEDLYDIVVIAATNRPDMIDPGLLRPGRFDRMILTPIPSEKARAEIFKVHTKNMPIKADLAKLAKMTPGYVGADIEAVCREAAIFALRKNFNAKLVEETYFLQALKKVRPSVTKEVEQAYEQVRDTFTSARAKELKDEKPSYMG